MDKTVSTNPSKHLICCGERGNEVKSSLYMMDLITQIYRSHCYLLTVRDHSVLICYVVDYIIQWSLSFTFLQTAGPGSGWLVRIDHAPFRLLVCEAPPLFPDPGSYRSLKAPGAPQWACLWWRFLCCGTVYKREDPVPRRWRKRSRGPVPGGWWRRTAGKALKTVERQTI